MRWELNKRLASTVWWWGLVGATAAVAAPPIPWTHAATYQPAVQTIAFADNPTGLFRAEEAVTIRVADRSAIAVYDRAGRRVFAGPPVTSVWPAGYYFVESATDRTAFAVLPAGYLGAPHLGNDAELSLTSTYEQNAARAGVGWTRLFLNWPLVTTPRMTWGKYDFTRLDQALDYAAVTRRKLFIQLGFWPAYLREEAAKTPERYAQYVAATVERIAGHSNGTACAALTLWNEPYEGAAWPVAVSRRDLAEIYRRCAPLIQARLPGVWVVGGNNMDFGYAFQMLPTLQRHRALVPEVNAVGHHYYDCVRRVDEPVFYGATLDEKLARLRAFFPVTAPLFLDEVAVFGSRLAEGAGCDVLGVEYRGNENPRLAGVACGDWADLVADEIKKAVIFRKHQAIVIGHNAFRGSHDAARWNGIYDGWFCGVTAGGVERLRGPRPGLAGFLAANHWLVDATFVATAVSPDRLHLYEFRRRNGEAVVFAWCRRGQTAVRTLPAGWRRTDVFGQVMADETITHEPVLFHGPAGSPSAAGLEMLKNPS